MTIKGKNSEIGERGTEDKLIIITSLKQYFLPAPESVLVKVGSDLITDFVYNTGFQNETFYHVPCTS